MPSVLETLSERGFIEQVTDPELGRLLAKKKVTLYAGFDPSAVSLHIGHLVPIMGLSHFQRAGHTPLLLVGGATGMIGDPSGKSEERNLLTANRVQEHSDALAKQMTRFVSFDGDNAAQMLNNADWIGEFSYLEWLRDVGKHFTVNMMLAKESVKRRVDSEQGISYTEFSYMLLQAYDFLHLFRKSDCVLQVGGSDQWGNITAGVDLIRRVCSKQAFGATFTLIKSASGEKFGKTAAGAIWLDAEKTSVWDFYQYWIRVDDRDVIPYLKLFTFLPMDQIAELEQEVVEQPGQRTAQRILASEATTIVHGADQAEAMEKGAKMLYGQELKDLADDQLQALFADAPSYTIARGLLADGMPIVDLLAESKLTPSKSEARRRLKGGGIYVNNVGVDDSYRVTEASLASPSCIVLRSGKKNYLLVRVA